MTEKWISKDKTRSLNTVGTLFLCLQLCHGLMYSLFVMYLKKWRASDWLKTSTFSWNPSANFKYRARFQNFVCLDFLRFCVILCITAKYTCPTGSANFVFVEKFAQAYLHQIALVICHGPCWENLWPRSWVLKTEETFFPNANLPRLMNNVFIFFQSFTNSCQKNPNNLGL